MRGGAKLNIFRCRLLYQRSIGVDERAGDSLLSQLSNPRRQSYYLAVDSSGITPLPLSQAVGRLRTRLDLSRHYGAPAIERAVVVGNPGPILSALVFHGGIQVQPFRRFVGLDEVLNDITDGYCSTFFPHIYLSLTGLRDSPFGELDFNTRACQGQVGTYPERTYIIGRAQRAGISDSTSYQTL